MEIKQHILNNEWVKEQLTRETRKYLQTNENESTTYANLWDAVLRKKFIIVNTYIKIEEFSQINNLTLYLREVEQL